MMPIEAAVHGARPFRGGGFQARVESDTALRPGASRPAPRVANSIQSTSSAAGQSQQVLP